MKQVIDKNMKCGGLINRTYNAHGLELVLNSKMINQTHWTSISWIFSLEKTLAVGV